MTIQTKTKTYVYYNLTDSKEVHREKQLNPNLETDLAWVVPRLRYKGLK